jgi:hypothetical protein
MSDVTATPDLTREDDLVKVDKSKLSDLWKKEDWLAVWIGFIVIAIAAVGVITGAYDFSAAKFSTWGNGVNPLEQLTGAFWLKLLLTAVVLGVLFTVGAKLKGQSVRNMFRLTSVYLSLRLSFVLSARNTP